MQARSSLSASSSAAATTTSSSSSRLSVAAAELRTPKLAARRCQPSTASAHASIWSAESPSRAHAAPQLCRLRRRRRSSLAVAAAAACLSTFAPTTAGPGTYPVPETEKERSPIDFPQEWVTPAPSRRPDTQPEFERLEAVPPPRKLPGDPELPDEEEAEEEEKKRAPEPGEPGEGEPGEGDPDKEDPEQGPIPEG